MQRITLTGLTALLLMLLAACTSAAGTDVTVETAAGTGESGLLNGPSTGALFSGPEGLALAPDGTLYVAETLSGRIRKIDPDGIVSTVIDNDGTNFDLKLPSRLAVSPDGFIYLTDAGNNRIVRFTPDGDFEVVAGTGERGDSDGTAGEAEFDFPIGIAVAGDGSVYVADSGNKKIRKIAPDGTITTVAGSGQEGFQDGVSADAMFAGLNELAVDPTGNIFVTEVENSRIRMISTQGVVSTIAGTGERGLANGDPLSAKFDGPAGIGVDADGNLYIAEFGNQLIRKIVPGESVTTYAGNGDRGLKNGNGSKALFSFPTGLIVSPNGVIFIADSGNNVIRTIKP